MLSVEVGGTTTTHLNHIFLGLGTHFFRINALSNKNRAMSYGMKKWYELKQGATMLV